MQSVVDKGALRWDGKIQCSVVAWKINWFKLRTWEVKCYSSQAQDSLGLDISAGKSKFCPIHTSFISDTIKNHLALFSPPLLLLVCVLYVLLSTTAFASRLPWGILFPVSWYHDATSKCEVFRHPGTQQRELKKTNTVQISQTLVPWANTLFAFPSFLFRACFEGNSAVPGIDLGGVMVLHVLAELKIFSVIRGLILNLKCFKG